MRWTVNAFLLTLFCMTAGFAKSAQAEEKCYELRTYYSAPGKFEALQSRFRDHTMKLFAKHGIKVVGFWTPSEGAGKDKMLVYVCEYANKDARTAAWKAFRADPDWVKAKAESEVNGSLTEKVEETFMTSTDYANIK